MRYLLAAFLAVASLTVGALGAIIFKSIIDGEIVDGLLAICLSISFGTMMTIGSLMGLFAAVKIAKGDL